MNFFPTNPMLIIYALRKQNCFISIITHPPLHHHPSLSRWRVPAMLPLVFRVGLKVTPAQLLLQRTMGSPPTRPGLSWTDLESQHSLGMNPGIKPGLNSEVRGWTVTLPHCHCQYLGYYCCVLFSLVEWCGPRAGSHWRWFITAQSLTRVKKCTGTFV